MNIIPFIIIGFVCWVLFGLWWSIQYHVNTVLDYKPFTIFIGGPLWWLLYVIEKIKNKPIPIKTEFLNTIRPRMKGK